MNVSCSLSISNLPLRGESSMLPLENGHLQHGVFVVFLVLGLVCVC